MQKLGLLTAIAMVLAGLTHGTCAEEPQRPVERQRSGGTPSAGPRDAMGVFVSKILGSTEHVWQAKFREAGQAYSEPKLVLFTRLTSTACGSGMSVMGPFYCPADRKVYLDLSFFDELKRRYHAPGDFAQAYVIAHEIGHHVQALLGIERRVSELQAKASETESNRLSVRLELQADCLAGIWASGVQQMWPKALEAGDIEQGLRATRALGDDMIQRQATGKIVLDSFTHGSGEERSRWFQRGLETGSLKDCNTFLE